MPTTSTTPDPITQVYLAICRTLDAWSGLTRLVRVSVNLTDPAWRTTSPFRSYALGQGDLPELILMQGRGSSPVFGANSINVDFSQEYRLVITTDTMGVDDINAVKWNVIVAIMKGGDTFGTTGVVKDFRCEWADGVDVGRPGTGDKRMASIFSIRTELYQSRASLLALT
jgi:hypothetical protein